MLGAGSVGCFIGGCWQAAGVPVTFIGRARLASDIAEHGLTLSDYTGWQTHLPSVDYRTDPRALADADVIALCVKSGSTAEAGAAIPANGRDGATVVSFQNGISNVDVLLEGLGERFEVIRGMVPYNVAYLGQGRFHKGVAGDLYAEDNSQTRALARLIGDSPARLKTSDDMLSLAWGKLLINLNNAVNALSGRSLMEELRQRDYRKVVAASQREGLKLLDLAGIKPASAGGGIAPHMLPRLLGAPNWLFNSVFLRKWKIDENARSSMADDLAARRTTEVDYINGELVTLAERLGVDAPVNRAIVRLVRRAESGAKPWPPTALRREILG